jgi:hypothetical protein
MGFCTTAEYFSSHSVYFLVASNPAVWLCYVLLYVCPFCEYDHFHFLFSSSSMSSRYFPINTYHLLNFNSSLIHFSTNSLGFTPEFLGRVKLVTSIASLLGVGLYNGFLKNVPLRKIFLGTTILGSALGMTQASI